MLEFPALSLQNEQNQQHFDAPSSLALNDQKLLSSQIRPGAVLLAPRSDRHTPRCTWLMLAKAEDPLRLSWNWPASRPCPAVGFLI